MACGTPVVSTRSGGPEEYVEDGTTGLIVGREGSDEFKNGPREMLRNIADGGKYGPNAHELIKSDYSCESIVPRFLDALDQWVNSQINNHR